MNFDQAVFNLVHGLAGQNRLLDLISIFLADYLGYFLIVLVLYLAFSKSLVKDWRQRYQYFLFTALALILSRGLFTEIIRFFYYRPRPFVALDFVPLVNHETASAFPSGHAAFYFVLALSVFYLISRTWGWRILAAVFLMGVARVFSGVHWPLDIVGGLAVAWLSVWLVRRLLKM